MSQSGKNVIIDSGPLVSVLAGGSLHHKWAIEQWAEMAAPILVCEAVISEATFLIKRDGYETDPLYEMLVDGVLELDFSANGHLPDIRVLMQRYDNLPMSFADACIVRMAELNPSATVFTLDSDFRIYRKHGNRVIPVLMPPNL